MDRRPISYKRYVFQGSSAPIPPRTIRRRKAAERVQQSSIGNSPGMPTHGADTPEPVQEGADMDALGPAADCKDHEETVPEDSRLYASTSDNQTVEGPEDEYQHSMELDHDSESNDDTSTNRELELDSPSERSYAVEEDRYSSENSSSPNDQCFQEANRFHPDAGQNTALSSHSGGGNSLPSGHSSLVNSSSLEDESLSPSRQRCHVSSEQPTSNNVFMEELARQPDRGNFPEHGSGDSSSSDDDGLPPDNTNHQLETDDWDFMRAGVARSIDWEAEAEEASTDDEAVLETDDVFAGIALDLHWDAKDNNDNLAQGMTMSTLCKTLLILATKMRHNLTYLATEAVTKLAGVLSNTDIPNCTKYFWKKTVNHFSKGMSIHHTCGNCFKYVGIAKPASNGDFEELLCSHCEQRINPTLNAKAGNIFLYFSLREQIKSIIEICKENCNYKNDRQKSHQFAFEDIFDGDIYRESVVHDMFTINFSVDGVPVFKSSNFKLCPLVCTLNDLDPKKRAEYIMLCGLWFGDGKPKDMNAYLTPFVAECRSLYKNGVTFVLDGMEQTKRVRVLMGVSDSVERPVLRCSTQFNGEYGCGLCLHPGIEIAKGRGSARVYPLKDVRGNVIPAGLRTHDETLIHSETKMFGIKGRSILFDIPEFDVINGLDLDWPHAVLFGVARQFAKLWFESMYHNRDFNFRKKLKDVDKFLLSIKPSLQISRTPRKISDYKHWKMHEWAIWLLFYSLPTLKLFHPHAQYVHHWALLVEAISILTKSSIMRSEIAYAEQCLLSFVEDVATLYGVEAVSFNVHLLTHLPKSVTNFSCLWTHSSFIYEDFYQDLLSFVQSSQGVAIQICDSMRMRFVVKQLLSVCGNHLNERERVYLENVLCRKLRSTPSVHCNAAALLGAGRPCSLKDNEFLALQRINVNVERGSPIYHYDRAIILKEIVQTKNYTRVTKRNSYVVLLKDKNVFEIRTFILIDQNDLRACYALGYYFSRIIQPFIRNRRLTHLICVGKHRQEPMASVSVDNILEKVTYLDIPGTAFNLVCVHPNHIELLV